MTASQLLKRIEDLEIEVRRIRDEQEYRSAVEGIRRGLRSAEQGEGMSVKKTFAAIRQSARVKAAK